MSEIIDSSKPCKRKIVERKASAAMAAVGRKRKGIKCAILVKRSTTTIIQVRSLDFSRSTIKSIDNSDHGAKNPTIKTDYNNKKTLYNLNK